MKNQLVFDTTDADTIADSDSVGAFVRSSDGTLIDHATINSVERLAVDSTLKDGAGNALTSTDAGGGIRALDVNLASPMTVDVDLVGVYDAGDNVNPDSAGLIAHSRAAAPDETDQIFRSTGATPSSDDIDPANVHALDVNAFGLAWDGTAWDRLTIDSGNLNVRIADSEPLEINDAALANTAIVAAANALAVADTAESAVASALANRKYLFIHNQGNRTAYIGGAGVTAANGFPLSPKSVIELRAGAAVDVQWVSDNTAQSIRTLELS